MTDAGQIPGKLLTTATAVMPHVDVDRALATALSLDGPFWPQLPNYSYYEDMYVQAAEHFPGIVLDVAQRSLRFSIDKFAEDLDETMQHLDDPAYFDISAMYSTVYQRFLALDLDILSLDIYANAEVFAAYAPAIQRFIDRGGILVWGIVPTGVEAFGLSPMPSLTERLETVWKVIWSRGVDRGQMIRASMLSPATCCLANPDRQATMDLAFAAVNKIPIELREKYRHDLNSF